MNSDIGFDRLMMHETGGDPNGGYNNNPKDPGGETKWGVSKRSYPKLNIKKLTRAEAKVIWRRDFWERIHGDELPDGIAFQAMDFAYHSGFSTAVRYLQRALGVADDGYWGPVTKAAAHNMQESDVIMLFNSERLDFMTRLNNWPNASRGWARRIASNLRYGAEDS